MLDKINYTYNTESINFNIVLNFQNVINLTGVSAQGGGATINIMSAHNDREHGNVTMQNNFGFEKSLTDSISQILKQFPKSNINLIPTQNTAVNNKIGNDEQEIYFRAIDAVKEELENATKFGRDISEFEIECALNSAKYKYDNSIKQNIK